MDAKQLWQATLERLQTEISSVVFTVWFENTSALSFEEGVLTVHVTTPFAKTQLENRFLESIRSTASEIAGTAIDVCFVHQGPLSLSIAIAQEPSNNRSEDEDAEFRRGYEDCVLSMQRDRERRKTKYSQGYQTAYRETLYRETLSNTIAEQEPSETSPLSEEMKQLKEEMKRLDERLRRLERYTEE